ncbi:helix-turn-helix transcriptional regulator [Rhizobium sophorae]|uniref:Transcriptional regulator n=3 Tax=Rhizobium TaxID=379 RepID=A0AA94V9H7_RHIRH|nr:MULTISPECIES: helix-turn-helix domain-containing protein [Rhizobium]NKL25456.1 transcriptional regulator [Rhizobium leguminosarum bv. viciae]NNU41086.1 helix-turn-helix transcriptional regulator [Rhizobium sophorae]NSY61772.1 helix-turn-helix transcriptional regulator [Agrobacterium tumefaciens]MBY5416156.1 helix-turn-helix transcriptional regulator [Rhizobium leguminosarum]NEH82997.1 transcriptional regulator [Rhizobium ruizarguesonis]
MTIPHILTEHPACWPVRDLLSTIGSKWAILLIGLLQERPKRFSELKREVGDITQKSLTSVLRELEKDGIVDRIVTPTIPPRVDYRLTPLGHSLWKALEALSSWAIENHTAVAEARRRYNAPSTVEVK